jgi:hypothetical protein
MLPASNEILVFLILDVQQSYKERLAYDPQTSKERSHKQSTLLWTGGRVLERGGVVALDRPSRVFRQRHGLQSITLTLVFYKNIYSKVIYVYFYESIFQDKSIHIVFTFPNSKFSIKIFIQK